MDREKIERINFLAHKQKNEGLSEAEKAEQKALREEYLNEIRVSFSATLDSSVILRPDGTRESVAARKKTPGVPPAMQKKS